MSETSPSLLDRLRVQPDEQSWQKLVDLYTPLIRGWLRRHAMLDQDLDDVVQEVLSVVVRRLPEFRRQERIGAFRCWLRTITVNCLRDHWRSQRRRPRAGGGSDFLQTLDEMEDPDSGLSRQWDAEHDQHVTHRLLEMIQPQFAATTWRAFELLALKGNSADAVAAELGLSVNAVFIAKSRVLARLREEGRGLLD